MQMFMFYGVFTTQMSNLHFSFPFVKVVESIKEDFFHSHCTIVLIPSVLISRQKSGYSWVLDPTDGYYVCGAYHILTNRIPTDDFISSDLLWRRDVPLKVSVFA